MPSDIKGQELVHDKTETCEQCRLWIAHTSYSLHNAGDRGIDADKVVANARKHREHGVLSEAHFHFRNEKCNERCVA